MKNPLELLLQLLFPERFSPDKEKNLFKKPTDLEVKILMHGLYCGYRVKEDRKFVVTVVPTDEAMRRRFGQFDVYSKDVHKSYKDDDVVVLKFIKNPHFESEYGDEEYGDGECGDEPPLILYT